uniref:protein SMG9-like n=1 Tax=Styela clava TaxID=7725 RepID=UPI00193AB7DA|nr:protein SMG9-like [Styela clava]
MADPGMYGGGIRRKRRPPRERPIYREKEFPRDSYNGRNDYRRNTRDYSQYESREKPVSTPHTVLKQPIILAKPDSNDASKQKLVNTASSPSSELSKMNLKSKNSFLSSVLVENSSPTEKYYGQPRETKPFSGKLDLHKANLSSKSTKGNAGHISPGLDSSASKSPDDTKGNIKSVKILDGLLHWTDCGIELLEDQTHFLVVGVLGPQGVGKSTIMSYLAGSDITSKKLIFPCQTKDVMEKASNMTVGVDMYVTEERTIFLDSQPLLSPSLLEQCIYNDRKMSAEYNGPAAGIEMQSLQLATLFLSICHVVIIMQDWFSDCSLYSFLQCAEMLKLTSPTPNSESSSMESEFDEFHPHVIFVQNKSEPAHFDPSCIISMSEMISNMLAHSKLLYKDSISLSKSVLLPNISLCTSPSSEINIFLIPLFNLNDNDHERDNMEDSQFYQLPKYTALPKNKQILKVFRNMILSIRRLRLTRQALTEKSWFYYAAKTWEAIKKSQMMAEFNRLLV